MKYNIILIVLVGVLIVAPLVFLHNAEFKGADDQISGIVSTIKPEYEPWFTALWEPPSGEIESLLFALQAAIGAGFIGYFFGYYKGKMSKKTCG